MNAAERARVLGPDGLAAAQAAGVAARTVVGERAVRRALRHLEAAAGGPLRPQCVFAATAHSPQP
jgi:hypothetical protein